MASALYSILVYPIELLIEITFVFMYKYLNNPGLSIIAVSLVVNLLILPMYKKSDAMQENERNKQREMAPWVNHIRRIFKGDERFMMLSEYYRQNDYRPIYALRGSVSLLLQIPFFIAAYHYLANSPVLTDASFLMISNLGAPDQLLRIGAFSVNVLPVLMTAINFISGAIYMKGFPLKDKLQLYIMACFFLVFLYTSPSGLVLYWTCNNLFSLFKNIFMKVLKHPRRDFNIIAAAAGAAQFAAALSMKEVQTGTGIYSSIVLLCFCLFPALSSFRETFAGRKGAKTARDSIRVGQDSKAGSETARDSIRVAQDSRAETAPANAGRGAGKHGQAIYTRLFLLGGTFLSLLLGMWIPSALVGASPAEFIDTGFYENPLQYVTLTFMIALGLFLWAFVLYALGDQSSKRTASRGIWILSAVCLVNFLFYGKGLGNLSSTLVFDSAPKFTLQEQLGNLFVLLAAAVILYFIWELLLRKKKEKYLVMAYAVIIAGAFGISAVNISDAKTTLDKMSYLKTQTADTGDDKPILNLSTKGKNVVVIMLDRAISGYVPYIFKQQPEVQAAFEGFTYYPDTLSYGQSTNFGSPALFGGYDYTPEEMDRRSSEKLADKHDEALKLMPMLFDAAGFDVTVCDPPYAGYKWVSDLSVFKDMPDVHAYHTIGEYTDLSDLQFNHEDSAGKRKHNFIYYSLFRVAPVVLQKPIYDDGNYLSQNSSESKQSFIDSFSVLKKLVKLTKIQDNDQNYYFSMDNESTHAFCTLQLPDYTVSYNTDNAPYLAGWKKQFDGSDGSEPVKMETEEQIQHYMVNAASYKQIAVWLDYLREQGVYDNTRIIIVSDHGRWLHQFESMMGKVDVQTYNPVLLVKDFNSKDYSVSNEFMTNADVPTIAMDGLVDDPVNPFTGNRVDSSAKTAHPQLVTTSVLWNIAKNHGNTFDTHDGKWYAVEGNIFDKNNWTVRDASLIPGATLIGAKK